MYGGEAGEVWGPRGCVAEVGGEAVRCVAKPRGWGEVGGMELLGGNEM